MTDGFVVYWEIPIRDYKGVLVKKIMMNYTALRKPVSRAEADAFGRHLKRNGTAGQIKNSSGVVVEEWPGKENGDGKNCS